MQRKKDQEVNSVQIAKAQDGKPQEEKSSAENMEKAAKIKEIKEEKKTKEEKIIKKEKRIKKAKKERPRNPKLDHAIAVMNRYSLLFHMLLSCAICFVIEWISRHSFVEACQFMVDRNLVFLYNAFLVWATLTLVYIVKRRLAARVLISVFWLFLGTINGAILSKRVSPFGWTDLKMVGDLFTMQSNYFTDTEAAIVIGIVAVVCILLIILWIVGPKFQGKAHRLAGVCMVAIVIMMVPQVTDAAKSSNVIASYFENLAQGYKDYGFVYSFTSSALDQGMSAPSGYSEEAVQAVLSRINGESTGTADASEETNVNLSDALTEKETDSEEAGEAFAAEDTYIFAAADSDNIDVTDSGTAVLTEVSAVKTASSDEADAAVSSDAATAEEETALEESESPEAAESLEESESPETAESLEESENQETAGSLEESEISEAAESSEDWEYPNIIVVLLESFINPDMINFLETSEEAVPNFEYLFDNYTSGYVEVPVVGAGTANTEFEILTGMSMQFFGLGEYPYKTILKETNCESIASDLNTLGYGTHVVHNNGGNFYSRANAFSQMGFDTFTCKEMMDIQEYTPLGTWPTDHILVGEVEKSLDYTADQQDFVYVITVGTHGDYPDYEVIEDPEITISGVEDEGDAYSWEYYVNMLHETDEFIAELIEMLEERDEPTYVVMFGDHLPTMGLTEEDMTTGSLFLTPYVTWNNLGLEKDDSDMTSYQLLADTLEVLGLDGVGTMFTLHQNRDSYDTEEEYVDAIELLQYDILYGEHYVYGGEDPYPASDLVMGTQDVVIDQVMESGDYYYVIGDNFTKWSKVYVNGEKISTTYYSSTMLRIKKSKVPDGTNTVVVNQVGSSNTIFRSSNEVELIVGEEETNAQTE
ncbi:MAG: LTA synthase family protein [Lachnospiraceae bacterium]|nr:LTA synthase family protein [Lachnospiraceae bacterium]